VLIYRRHVYSPCRTLLILKKQ